MIYRSNLTAPDLQPHFRYATSRVMGHSFGHDVLSDWSDKPDGDPVFGIYKECGFWTHDEAAILYNIVQSRGGGLWLDIGGHTGWTAAHVIAAGGDVALIEPMLNLQHWLERLELNLNAQWQGVRNMSALPSPKYADSMRIMGTRFDGVIIDGDHSHPWPLLDATNADTILRKDGVVLFHDAMGGPVWRGIYHLLDMGYKCKMYRTPHMVACCWRGDWQPPEHVPDPAIDWQEIRTNHMKDFAWERVTV